jgi:hypothetical protein
MFEIGIEISKTRGIVAGADTGHGQRFTAEVVRGGERLEARPVERPFADRKKQVTVRKTGVRHGQRQREACDGHAAAHRKGLDSRGVGHP